MLYYSKGQEKTPRSQLWMLDTVWLWIVRLSPSLAWVTADHNCTELGGGGEEGRGEMGNNWGQDRRVPSVCVLNVWWYYACSFGALFYNLVTSCHVFLRNSLPSKPGGGIESALRPDACGLFHWIPDDAELCACWLWLGPRQRCVAGSTS